jgi:homoserine kinase
MTWENRIVRVAEDLPAVPIGVIPETTVSTAAARNSLPDSVPHADAAFTAGRAALLGAAVAEGSSDLFGAALHDRIHEPYRAVNAPLLEAVRSSLPEGALGATLSGSGPTVIVWAPTDSVDACENALAATHTDATVIRFAVSTEGACRE